MRRTFLVAGALVVGCLSGRPGGEPPVPAVPSPREAAPSRMPDAGPGGAGAAEKSMPWGIPQGDGPLFASLQTTMGRIVVRLYEHTTPETVHNFCGLATGTKEWTDPRTGETQHGRPLYDGTAFHRVMPDFMIQGGDPLSRGGDLSLAGSGGPGFRFADEIVPELHFDRPGRLAMANAGPGTSGSQFFITETAAPHLDGRHTIFGEVVKGFEIVPKIARVPTGPGGRPANPVVIEKITLSRGEY